MTEQEQDVAAASERLRAALVHQLFQEPESGDGDMDEGSSEDEDYEGERDDYDDDDLEDDDEEDDDEEGDDEDDDIRNRTFAFFGMREMGERTIQKQLGKHPKLSECPPEQLLHPAAQLLNLSSAAVTGKECLSRVGALHLAFWKSSELLKAC